MPEKMHENGLLTAASAANDNMEPPSPDRVYNLSWLVIQLNV